MTFRGKGLIIYKLSECEGGNPSAILATIQSTGFSHILIKIADGISTFGINSVGEDYTLPVVQSLRAAGIVVWGWHSVYGNEPLGEAAVAIRRIQELELDGYVLNAGVDYKQPGKEKSAQRFMDDLRLVITELPVALSSFGFPNSHPEFPWSAFLEKCNYHMPKVTWEEAHNPAEKLRESLRQCDALPNARPFLASCPAYRTRTWQPTPADILEFLDTARKLKLDAVNFNSWDYCKNKIPLLWQTIADFNWQLPGKVKIIPRDTQSVDVDIFIMKYLSALQSRRSAQLASLYADDAIRVRQDKKICGRDAIQSDIIDLFVQIPLGVDITLVGMQAKKDVIIVKWTAGSLNACETLVLKANKVIFNYIFSAG